MERLPYIGEICALAAPICWSFAIILFRKTGEVVPPLALNLFKNVLSGILFFITLVVLGQTAPPGVESRDYLLLLVSGAIGIGISDTLFLMTLNRVGAGLQAIINTSYSPAIIALSLLFLGERLSLVQALGVGLIISAVLSVIWMRDRSGGQIGSRALAIGIMLGLGTTLTQAVSIVMIKPLLGEVPLIWANCWRMLGGLAMSLLLLPLLSAPRQALASLRQVRVWPTMIPGTILGTYLALVVWLAGMKFTQASTASALNQTATLWTFVLAAIFLREPVTRLRLAGLLLGVGGVAMVTFGG